MELIPAIDLLGGRVVRLSKGAYDAVTEYGDDPVEVARRWAAEGAERIHIVDLDAAREGRAMQAEVIARIVAAVDVPCQVAGGIRDADAVAAALRAGADRVVLGSALISSPLLARILVERHGPDRIVAALDVRDGRALGDGWVEGARGAEVIGLAQRLADGRRALVRRHRHRPRRPDERARPGRCSKRSARRSRAPPSSPRAA